MVDIYVKIFSEIGFKKFSSKKWRPLFDEKFRSLYSDVGIIYGDSAIIPTYKNYSERFCLIITGIFSSSSRTL